MFSITINLKNFDKPIILINASHLTTFLKSVLLISLSEIRKQQLVKQNRFSSLIIRMISAVFRHLTLIKLKFLLRARSQHGAGMLLAWCDRLIYLYCNQIGINQRRHKTGRQWLLFRQSNGLRIKVAVRELRELKSRMWAKNNEKFIKNIWYVENQLKDQNWEPHWNINSRCHYLLK